MSRYLKMIAWLVVLSSMLGACAPNTFLPGKLNVMCCPQEDLCQAMTKAFRQETGLQVNYVRMSSGEVPPRLKAGQANPEFDVWYGGPITDHMVAKDQDLLEPHLSPNATIIPARYKDQSGYWTGVYVGALGFCSNQQVLDKLGVPVPQAWDDLLEPRLKKQVALAHPATSGTAFTAVWTLVTLNGFDEDKAFAYLRKLHNSVLQYPSTGSTPGQMAGRGEVAVAIIFAHDCLKLKAEGMKDLVVSFPQEGTGYEIGGVSIVKGAKHPDAAKKYVAWVLTAQAQEILPTVKSYQFPTNPEARVQLPPLPPFKLMDYDFVRSAERKKDLIGKFEREIAPAPKQ